MNHHSHEVTTITDALERLTANGFEGMAHAIEILMNEAVKLDLDGFVRDKLAALAAKLDAAGVPWTPGYSATPSGSGR